LCSHNSFKGTPPVTYPLSINPHLLEVLLTSNSTQLDQTFNTWAFLGHGIVALVGVFCFFFFVLRTDLP
jgi:hypothetical protein